MDINQYLVGMIATAFLTACGGEVPVAPTPPMSESQPAVARPPAISSTRSIDGLVRDGDDSTPIPGAIVAIPYSSTPQTTSDGNGYFVTFHVIPPGYASTPVWISKAGYEETHTWVLGRDDGRSDLRLYRPRVVTAGASTRFPITSGNSTCGFDDELLCRPVQVRAPAAGTLVVETSSDNRSEPYWIHVGPPGAVEYPFRGVTRVTRPVTAGSVLTVQIMRPWVPPTTGVATVNTSLTE